MWYKKIMSATNMTVCTLVLDPNDAKRVDDVITFLTQSGIAIDKIDRSTGTLEVTGETHLLAALEKHEMFGYLRKHFCYQKHDHKVNV